MQKKNWSRIAVPILVATVLCQFAWLVATGFGRGPSRLDLDSIQMGMLREQVHAKVHCPPDDYRTNKERFDISHHSIIRPSTETWISDEGMLELTYDEFGRVDWRTIRNVKDNWLDPVRRLILEQN